MADNPDNVIVYPGPRRSSGPQYERSGTADGTARQLDELSCRLQQFSPHSSWPPQRWMIAMTPFRMRLVGVRRQLDDLAMSPLGERHGIRWALKFNHVRLEAERRLHDIDASLASLQRSDASPAERIRDTETFTFSRSGFLRALEEIQELIEEGSPEH